MTSSVILQLLSTDLLLVNLTDEAFYGYGIFMIVASLVGGFLTISLSNDYTRLAIEKANQTEIIFNYLINSLNTFKYQILLLIILSIIILKNYWILVLLSWAYGIMLATSTSAIEYSFLQNNLKEYALRTVAKQSILYSLLVIIKPTETLTVVNIVIILTILEVALFYKYITKLIENFNLNYNITKENLTLGLTEVSSNFVDRIIITMIGAGNVFTDYYTYNQIKTGLFTFAKPFTRNIWISLLKNQKTLTQRAAHLFVLIGLIYSKSIIISLLEPLQLTEIQLNIQKNWEVIILTYFAAFLGKSLKSQVILSRQDSLIRDSNIISLLGTLLFSLIIILSKRPDLLIYILLIKYSIAQFSLLLMTRKRIFMLDSIEYIIFLFYACSHFLS